MFQRYTGRLKQSYRLRQRRSPSRLQRRRIFLISIGFSHTESSCNQDQRPDRQPVSQAPRTAERFCRQSTDTTDRVVQPSVAERRPPLFCATWDVTFISHKSLTGVDAYRLLSSFINGYIQEFAHLCDSVDYCCSKRPDLFFGNYVTLFDSQFQRLA